MKANLNLTIVTLLAASGLVSTSDCRAFPIAEGGEGMSIYAVGGASVVATYLGNSARYSNDLYLALDEFGVPGLDGNDANDLFLFNNHDFPVNSTVDLGVFPAGTELVFRIYVNDTGWSYFTGGPSRNPDGLAHARVQGNWLPGETLVSFEDLFGTPEYPGGFNDLSFSFSNTSVVPEPSAYLGVVGLGLVAFGIIRRGRRRRPIPSGTCC